jgi:SAM-dependent methyltransferase
VNSSLRNALESTVRASPLLGRPVGTAVRAVRTLATLPSYPRSWLQYRRMPGAEHLRLRDANPRLSDRVSASPYDPHYFHQAVWAAERIFVNGPDQHADVGSQLIFVGMLAAKMPVTFVDLRPLELSIAELHPLAGDVLGLPFPDRSVSSLSSLHVVEHVGLGRYGDELNPSGTRQALAELQRVLAPDGSLFISLPIGRPRVCFNAHRIHDPRVILAWLDELDLVEFSAVDDTGQLRLEASLSETADLSYGCGLFWFRRPTE